MSRNSSTKTSEGFDVFRIIIEDALSAGNVANRLDRKSANLSNSLRDWIGHAEKLVALIAELADDNKTLAARLREAHNVCDEEHRDVATASLIEVWIDETERRTWFLSEIKRGRQ